MIDISNDIAQVVAENRQANGDHEAVAAVVPSCMRSSSDLLLRHAVSAGVPLAGDSAAQRVKSSSFSGVAQ